MDRRALAQAAARRTGGGLAVLERRLGLTPSGVAVLACCVAGFAIGRWSASRMVLVLVYGAVAVLAVAWVLGRRGVSVEAARTELPSRLREGQEVEVQVSLRAGRRITGIVVEEQLPEPFGVTVRVPVPVLPGGEAIEHGYRFRARRRGVYAIGPLVAEWSDPFGLTRRRQQLLGAERILVHPTTEPVQDRVVSREWEDPPVRPPVSKPWPVGFEFYGTRDYQPGDDPRRIVWRATARTLDVDGGTTRYLVREAEQGITDRVHLVLDDQAAAYAGLDDDGSSFELAVRGVASVGAHHLEEGFSVALDTGGARIAAGLRGRRARLPLLDALAAVTPGEVPLTKALERLLVDPRRTAHNVVVTPRVDRHVAKRLQLLREEGRSVLLVLVVTDRTDPLVLHRAGTLGCPVVELRPGIALGRSFRRTVSAGRR